MSKRARGMHDDPLSAASAGLVALGIDRARRVDVLEVLGCLIDHADGSGQVTLDRELFAREEALGIDKCLDAYALLEQLDIVSRTDSGWTIIDYRFHEGPVGETEASLAILRKHLASVGAEASAEDVAEVAFEQLPAAAAVAVVETDTVVPLSRWRRAVPVAAGIAATAAAFVGATQLVPQAAVTGRNAANSSDSPTSIVVRRNAPTTLGAPRVSSQPDPTVATTPTSGLVSTSTTSGGTTIPLNCLLPQVLTSVKSIEVVRLPLGGKNGETIWAAVVKGTATLTHSDTSVLLPALNVVAHLVDGDTDAIQATISAPLLVPDTPAPFSAVVALGKSKPTNPVTVTASAPGYEAC